MTTYREALNRLLSVCDGAHEKDECGFNAVDSPIARSLAGFGMWSEKQQNLVINILRKYSGQLDSYGMPYSELQKELTKEEKVKAYEEARKKMEALPQERPILDFKDDVFSLKIPFDKKELAKGIGPHRWDNDKKVWTYHIKSRGIIEALYEFVKSHPELDIVVKSNASDYIDTYFKEKARFEGAVKEVASIKSNGVPDIPVPLKTKPYDHQKRAFLIGTTLDSSAFLMEMGTGKTLAAIAVAGKRFADKEVSKLLVLAPLSILHVWKHEFEQHAAFPVNVVILNDNQMGKKKKKVAECAKPKVLNVLVVSYESAWRMPDELKQWKPDMVILDESQRVKNKGAKRSEFVHELGDAAKYKIILSGTPVTQSPVDLYSQYRFLNKDIFGTNFYQFRNRYCIMGGFENKQIVGFKSLDDLIQKAHSIAYRVTKEEALDLPDFTDEVMYFDLKKDGSLQVYQDMEQKMRVEIESGKCSADILLAQMTRLSQIAGGFLPLTDASGKETMQQIGTEKLDLLRTIIEDYPRNKKLVIFCRFIPEIEAITNMLKEMKISYAAISGETKSVDREKINDRFQKTDEPKVIILQIRVGGLGITLTAADTMIFFSNTFSYAEYEQARARIHRSGQKNHCTYIQLVAKNTIDESIVAALKEKKDVADMVVDQIIPEPKYQKKSDKINFENQKLYDAGVI